MYCFRPKKPTPNETRDDIMIMHEIEPGTNSKNLAHMHAIIGMDGHIKNKQAWRKTANLQMYKRRYRQITTFDQFAATMVYMLGDTKHKINGISTTRFRTHVVKVLRALLEQAKARHVEAKHLVPTDDIEVDMDEESIDSDEDELLGDEEFFLDTNAQEDTADAEFLDDLEGCDDLNDACKSIIVDCQSKARTSKEDYYRKKEEEQMKFLMLNCIFDKSKLIDYLATNDNPIGHAIRKKSERSLTDLFTMVKAKVVFKGLELKVGYSLGGDFNERSDWTHEDCIMYFRNLTDDWQQAILSTALLILQANYQRQDPDYGFDKTWTVWFHGPANTGKTYFFNKGLSWLKPHNLASMKNTNFPFNGIEQPGFYCMMDDNSLTFAIDEMLQMFKNIASGQEVKVNVKYGGMMTSFPQPIIILSNAPDVVMLNIRNVQLENAAIKTRLYHKVRLYHPASAIGIQDLYLFWYDMLHHVSLIEKDILLRDPLTSPVNYQLVFDMFSRVYFPDY